MSEVLEKPRLLVLNDFINLSYPRLAKQKKEEVWLALLDGQHRLISFDCISKGCVDYVDLNSRLIIQKSLEFNASSIFLFHNHPAGTPKPSHGDIDATKKLAEIVEKIGIRFLDHMIVTEKKCVCILDGTVVDM